MEVISQNENKVFDRVEAKVKITYSGVTPDRNSLKKDFAKKFNVKKENVMIKQIKPEFGKSAAIVTINAYNKAKDLEDVELPSTVKKNRKEASAMKAEPKEEPEESKESEEKSEEPAEKTESREEVAESEEPTKETESKKEAEEPTEESKESEEKPEAEYKEEKE